MLAKGGSKPEMLYPELLELKIQILKSMLIFTATENLVKRALS